MIRTFKKILRLNAHTISVYRNKQNHLNFVRSLSLIIFETDVICLKYLKKKTPTSYVINKLRELSLRSIEQ